MRPCETIAAQRNFPLGNSSQSVDPWNEHLFYRRLPVAPPILRQEKNDAASGAGPAAMPADPHAGAARPRLRAAVTLDEAAAELPSPVDRLGTGIKFVAGLVASLLVGPAIFGFVSRAPHQARELPPANTRTQSRLASRSI